MGTMTYGEQLKHPNWQKKRLQMLEAAGWACVCCDTKEVTLHVHHKRYIKGRMAWDYDDTNFEVLCEPCHQEAHAHQVLLQRLLAESDMGGSSTAIAIGIVAGYLDASVAIDPDLAAEAMAVSGGDAYDAGVMASLASGAGWKQMAAAARCIAPRTMSPAQSQALARWDTERS